MVVCSLISTAADAVPSAAIHVHEPPGEGTGPAACSEPAGEGTGPTTCRPGPPTRRPGFIAPQQLQENHVASPIPDVRNRWRNSPSWILRRLRTSGIVRTVANAPASPEQREGIPRSALGRPGELESITAHDREEQALRAEQLEAARELQRRHPSDEAFFILGAVFNEQGLLDEAIRCWREGLALPPSGIRLHDRANVLANLGEVLRVREEDSAAEAAFRESLRLNPRREETRFRLAGFLYQQNRPAECLALLDASRESSARVVALRGQACQRLDRVTEARRHYEAALSLEADCSEALYGLLSLSLRLGDDAAAAEYQRRFAALKARQQQSGRSLREQFSPLQVTRQSLALTHTAIGWVYAEGGETSKAEATWRRAVELDPSHTACRFHLMMLLQKTGRNPEALRLCEELIRLEPANAFHQLSLGNLQVRLGATEQAATAFRTAHELAPQRPETCFALAQFYLRNNTNLTEAVALAQQAVNLAPVAPHYYILSRLRAKTSAPDAARAAAVRATELDPDNRDYREWRAALEAP